MPFRSLIFLLTCLLAGLSASSAHSEVQTNVTPSGATAIAPDGNTGRINISGGVQKGGNLFHSFEKFSIGKGSTAYFQNSSGSSVTNIINHITGGVSRIDGEINSREYGNANLFMINPNGIIFGDNAKLEVGGSFFASTANALHFEDGSTLLADVKSGNNLSSAPVSAFGFLDNDPAPVKVNSARLSIDKGRTLTIAAGDITIDNGARLKANEGEIKLLSRTDSTGKINLDNPLLENSNGHIDIGVITIQNGATIRGTGDKSSVLIQAEALLIEGNRSEIRVKNSGDSGKIRINLTGNLSVLNGGRITTTTTASGDTATGIEIAVEKGDIIIAGQSEGAIPRGSQISSSATGEGSVAGHISILAKESAVQLTDGGKIKAVGTGFGPGAKAGDITLVVDELVARSGGQIINRASGDSSGGTVTVTANTLRLSGDEPGIQSETAGTGNAGNIVIRPKGKNIVIKGNGEISANSTQEATGNAGNIDIGAAGSNILITDGIKISAITTAAGMGGNITVNGSNIDITNGANLSAESQSEGVILPNRADNPDTGKSGSISVMATDSLILDNGKISLNTRQTDAGNIIIRGGKLFRMDNQSTITTSVAEGRGNGGDISINENIDSNLVVLSNSSEIRANAKKGAGGNINIKAYSHLISPDSIIDASAGPAGIDGSVTVTTPDVDATTGILQLPESFLDASTLLSSRCSTRTVSNSSSFVIKSEHNMTAPDTLLTGTVPNPNGSVRNTKTNSTYRFVEKNISKLLSKQTAVRCW